MNMINWKITPQVAQYIRQVLGQRPFDEAQPVIADLMQQAEQQELEREKEKTKGEIKAA